MTYEQVILERAQHDYEGVDDYLLNMKKSRFTPRLVYGRIRSKDYQSFLHQHRHRYNERDRDQEASHHDDPGR